SERPTRKELFQNRAAKLSMSPARRILPHILHVNLVKELCEVRVPGTLTASHFHSKCRLQVPRFLFRVGIRFSILSIESSEIPSPVFHKPKRVKLTSFPYAHFRSSLVLAGRLQARVGVKRSISSAPQSRNRNQPPKALAACFILRIFLPRGLGR